MKDLVQSALSVEAYQIVRSRILRGELPLGQAISRRKIAAELGMSFLPVSEALLRLEHEGLLESRPRVGTRVRIPTRQDVEGHYVVREALETQAARLFAELATAKERQELIKMATEVDRLYKQDQRVEQYLVLHERLHRRIAECARCPALSDAIEQTHALASTWLCVKPPPDIELEELDRKHQQLAEAVCSRDPDVATQGMRNHIQISLRRTLIRLAPYFQIGNPVRLSFSRSPKQINRRSKGDV